uniref:Coiled-coil domain containing 191 n=1 Tax=Pundamilia nyererei TaxID=303518 RepID=A0A3B4F8D1_9CICH
MAFPGHNSDLFRWRRVGSANKVSLRVEMASEFAVSEVFSHKKPHSGISSLAVPLQSTEQLRDHDEAYSEAQALLGDWLSNKLRLELELEDEDDLMCSAERTGTAASASAVPAALNYNNFDELYNCLVEEEEQSAVKGFLQDLMEQELLDSRMMEDLALDAHQTRKRFRDPIVTMEARHQQVRENRAQREAERQRQQRERDVLRAAREEAKKREQEEQMRKRQEKRRQEEMVQQEMVRLRRQMEERRGLEQTELGKNLRRKYIYINCQRHFSGWYSVVLDRRLRMGKAKALYDWKRQLKAWRAWRAVVWAERKQREVARTEEALRTESRQCQLAAESDRRRLLRRCLNEWQLWCRTEKEQRELLARQQEIKQKMAALISAASAGKLKATESLAYRPIMAPPEAPNRTTEKVRLTNPHVISMQTSYHFYFGTSKTAVVKKNTSKFNGKHNFQAQMKAAEELRLREEEEEKRKAAGRRREEKRLERQKRFSHEKQKQLKRQRELMALARQHHCRTLLLRRGLAPWKRLIQLRQASVEVNHLSCPFQLSVYSDTGSQQVLLYFWLKCFSFQMRDIQIIQEERAERFYRTRTLRRFLLALLDHVTQERLVEWEHQELALEHNERRVLRQCFLAWRQLPCLLRKEREKDERREKLCRKVTEVLPDFCSHPL